MCVYIAIIANILLMTLWRVDSASALKCYGLQAGILAGRALREKQCTLEREARYMNVQDSVHWEGVYSVGVPTRDAKFFKFIIKIDQSETTKSHMFIFH